jgi:hypothetical protein
VSEGSEGALATLPYDAQPANSNSATTELQIRVVIHPTARSQQGIINDLFTWLFIGTNYLNNIK